MFQALHGGVRDNGWLISQERQHWLILHLGESTAPRLQSPLPKISQEHGDAGDGEGLLAPLLSGLRASPQTQSPARATSASPGDKRASLHPAYVPTPARVMAAVKDKLRLSPSPPIVFTAHACQGRPGSAPKGADPGKPRTGQSEGGTAQQATPPPSPICRVPGCTCLCLGT